MGPGGAPPASGVPADHERPDIPAPRDPGGRGTDGPGSGGHGTPPGGRRRRRTRVSFSRVLGLTVLGALIPGAGLLAAGRRRFGIGVLVALAFLLGVAAYFATVRRREVLHLIVQPDALVLIGSALVCLGVGWVAVIVATHRSLRPRSATPLQRMFGSLVVTVLALAVLTPLAIGSRYAFVQRDVVTTVFAGDDTRSETRPENVTVEDPWAGQDRVNVLLLGGDGGKGRDGVRTDSVLVASIDTDTGNTVLFSLPRNLENVPFPPDSVLADAYPGGVFDGPGDELEWMLNAMYRNVPAQNPGLLHSDHEGADVLKMAVGEALGIKLDYFVLINLAGFQSLVSALGGITVNVNQPVAIGGSVDYGVEPKAWIQPGPNQHLDGYEALWFARGRYGSDDYQRMDRQRCTMKAIIDQANPASVLRRYEGIARSSKNIVETDIPGKLLPAFVDLSMVVKKAQVTSIVFDNDVIVPYDPDYDLIRSKVSSALEASAKSGSSSGSESGSAGDGAPSKPKKPAGEPTAEPDGSEGSGTSGSGSKQPRDSLENTCAYRPQQ